MLTRNRMHYKLFQASLPNTEKYRNFRTAAQHFQVAAQAGHLHAQHRLANMHLHGVGMEKNCQAAVRLFKKVAESGNNVVKIKRAHALLAGNSKYAIPRRRFWCVRP